MIQRALAGAVERDDERALDKIGRMWNAIKDESASSLQPSTRELATFRNGAKDMVI